MSELQIVSLNEAGQLNLPDEVLKSFLNRKITKFVIFPVGESFTLKPIEKSNSDTFLELAKESNDFISSTNIKEKELPQIIQQVRDEHSS